MSAPSLAPAAAPVAAVVGAAVDAAIDAAANVAGVAASGSPAQAALSVPRYRAERLGSLAAFLARWQPLVGPNALPFHHSEWVEAWYTHLGHLPGTEPLFIAVQREGAGDALLLPLVLRRAHGLRWVEFADAGVVDYVAPLCSDDWHGGAEPGAAARALWQALRLALAGTDVLRVEKLLARALPEAGGQPNPLCLAWPVVASPLFGNQFQVGGDWEDWRRSLDKRVRKEIERCWRVFHRSPEAGFERVTDPQQAEALMATLEQQQSERLQPVLGDSYKLDQPAYRSFYRQVLAAGLANGRVVLTVLRDGPHVVSALFGLANAQRYIGLRQSLGGQAWMHCSPGRLLDEQTARHMHEQGLTQFDFGVGDYFHKTTLKMAQIPLLEVCIALSLRGKLAEWAWRGKRQLKQHPRVMAAWRRLQSRWA